ncbi:MAG: MFS transporter [Candidatus Paceibacterota bacterium]|jgi:MFS family permease
MLDFFKQSYSSNIPKFYVAIFFDAMWFAGPVWILYFLSIGLNFEQIGILVGISFIVQAFFEIPSSVWADRYSRKNILIIGMSFWFVAQIIFLSANSFYFFIFAAIFQGLSNSFFSGTESAIVYDTLLNMGREKEYGKIQSKIHSIFFLGRIIISIGGVLAYSYDKKLPFLLSVITSLIAVFIFSLIKEPRFHKSSGTHFGQMKEGFGFLLANEKVWLIVLVFSLLQAAANILYNYYQPVFDLAGLPIAYFAVVYLGINIASYIGSMSYSKLANKLSFNKILAIYLLIAFLVSLAFAFGKLIFILPLVLFLSFCFGSFDVYITSLINKVVPSSHRATTISIQSLINTVMMSFLLIIVGRISNEYSIFWGMIFNAGVILFACVAFLYVKINNSKLNK